MPDVCATSGIGGGGATWKAAPRLVLHWRAEDARWALTSRARCGCRASAQRMMKLNLNVSGSRLPEPPAGLMHGRETGAGPVEVPSLDTEKELALAQ